MLSTYNTPNQPNERSQFWISLHESLSNAEELLIVGDLNILETVVYSSIMGYTNLLRGQERLTWEEIVGKTETHHVWFSSALC